MSRRQRHAAAKAELAALGKDLSRRSRSRCELCSTAGGLMPVALTGATPTLLDTVLLCDRCARVLDKGPGRDEADAPDALRFLEEVVWAELFPIQVAAVTMLHRVAQADIARWPSETLETVFVDDDVQAAVNALLA